MFIREMTIEYCFPPLGKDSWRHPNDGGRLAPGALALTSISLLELFLPSFTALCFGKRMQIKGVTGVRHHCNCRTGGYWQQLQGHGRYHHQQQYRPSLANQWILPDPQWMHQ